MFITRAEIKGCDRFELSMIDEFIAEFSSPLQIVIGTNGSGKSSLLDQLTLLPAKSSDFSKGGYKIIYATDKGNNYRAESHFGKHTKHMFFVNGENLNISGKETEQRKLVQDHFGVTQQLHRLATGEILFSRLSSQARRDWLMSISNMNFDYAMKTYAKVRDLNKESNALIKSMSERHNDEKEKLEQIGDVIPMQKRAGELSVIITKLMRMQSDKKPRPLREIQHDVKTKIERLKTESHTLVADTNRNQLERFPTVSNLEELVSHIAVLASDSERYKEQLEQLYKKKQDIVMLAERSRDNGVDLETEIKAVSELKAFLDQPVDGLIDNPDVLHDTVDNFLGAVRLAATGYKDNTDLKFNGRRQAELNKQLSDMNLTANNLRLKINGTEHDIRHCKDTPMADCPECKTHFRIDNADVKLEELLKLQSDLEDQLTKLEKDKGYVEHDLEEFNEFLSARRELFALLQGNTNSAVQRLRTMISEAEQRGIGSRGVHTIIDSWLEVVETSRDYFKKKNEYESRNFALKYLLEIEELKKHYEGTQLDDIDTELDALIHRSKQTSDLITEAKTLVERSNQRLCKFASLKELEKSLVNDHNDMVFYHEQTAISEVLLLLQTELATIQSMISKVESIRHTIENLDRYRSDYIADYEASKELMEILSPNTGLIADYIMSFLEPFVDSINEFIASVWEYDLEILPCKVDGDEIDYKFPVRIENSSKERPDIAFTSKAQMGFINLIFKLSIINASNSAKLPLFLDEPAEGFDEKHSENFVRFISAYLEHGNVEQIFLVSHNYTGHASFSQAEFLIMDEENILDKPAVYNEHVRFIRN
jgi:DNA repair exonuclease SbcCD ATPase subunit